MKRLSLQWRITLLTVLLIGAACVSMKLLLCASGLHYMDSIGSFIQDYGSAAVEGDPAFFDPELAGMNEDVTIVIHGAKTSFCTTNWYITAAVTPPFLTPKRQGYTMTSPSSSTVRRRSSA